ncbi:MAG: hypothetical protein M3451_07935, partial [Chloroflexota bacterium]|nr:hypothetical protein [Chloroflexota bacterium]
MKGQHMQERATHGINRRRVVQGGGSLIAGVAGWNVLTHVAAAQTPEPVRDQIVVDLDGDVSTFDPALTYTTRGWSIV